MNVTTNIPHYPEWKAYLRTGSRSRSSFGGEMTLFFRQRLRKSSSRLCRRPSCTISTAATSSLDEYADAIAEAIIETFCR